MRKKIIKKVVAILTVVTLLIPNATQAYAADPVRGVQTNVDSSGLDKAVEDAKKAGVQVTQGNTEDKGTVDSKAAADAKRAEITADYERQIRELNEARAKLDDYNAKKAEYDKKKKQYDEDFKKYKKAQEEYEKALEELKKHKDENGYLKSPIGQPLVFESEPDAVLNVPSGEEFKQGKFYNYALALNYLNGNDNASKAKRDIVYDHIKNFDDNPNHKGKKVFLKKDKTLTARYTNLKRSYMNGKKISRIEYRYTLKSTGNLGGNEIPAFLYSDPTITLRYWSFFSNIKINIEVKMYDEQNNEIDTTGALLDFQSLNRGHGYATYNGKNAIEKVSYHTGEPLEINGSSVKAHGNDLYADKSNYSKKDGSAYESGEWDSETSKLNWYGAIVGKQTRSNINFDIESDHCVNVWFAFDSKVKPKDIPKKPTPPVPPVEPKKPDAKVTYHYSVFYVKSKVEKKVYDAQGQDINEKVVKKDSVVDFTLNASDFPKGHEDIDSLVFKDTLPEDYALDLDKTKAKSPDYDVSYDQNTRLLTFTAKASLLAEINKDKTKDAEVPSPKITGKVTKEGKTYENKFELKINNTYKVESNPVRVYTPTGPVKKVFKEGDTTTNIDGKRVEAGQVLEYAITYKNTTGKKVTATITDRIPDFTEFVSADNGGVNNNGTITWTKEVEKDKSLTVTFKVRVKKDVNGEVLKNKAKVNDGKNDYDTNEVTNPTPTKPKKEVFKSGTTTNIDGKKVKAGEELTYKITYKNTTGKEADVTITDKVPKYTKFISADNGGVYKGGVIKWRKTLKEGESWTVSFKVKVDEKVSGEVIKNVAKVRDGENEFTTNEVTNPTPVKPKKPKTGDDTNMMMLFMLLLGSFGAAVPVARRRRKNK